MNRKYQAMAASVVSLLSACNESTGSTHHPASIQDYASNSKIKNIVLIVQENKSFDAYFGKWCEAPAGSNPSCTEGRSCCEAAPAADPGGSAPVVLDDDLTQGFDPNHNRGCMLAEINGGAMDRYTQGAGDGCSDARNFSIATDAVKPYWDLADKYAIADRYFQPLAGASAANNMYFAYARFKFNDNDFKPDYTGNVCSFISETTTYTEPHLGNLLEGQGLPWKVYAEGLASMRDANGTCPPAPPECGFKLPVYPCDLDPSDLPFAYQVEGGDDTAHFADFADFEADLAAGTLPAFSYVKFLGYKSEHAGVQVKITDGIKATDALVARILASDYADRTLILVTWDESGGYYDHIAPPATSPVDSQPYGARAPLLVLGPFAKQGAVSHVELEHSSVVKFVEWNFLGGQTGQLGARDTIVNNLGSLLDPVAVGVAVPD